ncbi:MAG: hypothetical protein IKF90_18165 [Parasporobacterium sp.]|nr:hypothetical protein [Parasporobacterium sp.]
MIYTAIVFLIGTSIIGGNNNTVFPLFAGIGVMMTGFFASPFTMYIVDLVALVVGFIMMIFTNDEFVGKH